MSYLKILADYVIQHHYPHLIESEKRYARLLHEVAIRTGDLIARMASRGMGSWGDEHGQYVNLRD